MLGLRFLAALAAVLTAAFFAACGGGGGGSSGASTGSVSVQLADTTLPGFAAIYVTVDEVQVHPESGGGWKEALAPQRTVNLLDLVNGVREDLGVVELTTGHYTQMRLLLGKDPDDGLNLLGRPHPFANYFIDDAGNVVELKVPSGLQSGIKVVRGFDIGAGETTELLLDFDASRSVVMAGSSGQWLLKPVIKVLETVEAVVVRGTVSDADGPLAGVLVSAQVTAPAADEKDAVSVEAATVSAEDGSYALFLAPGLYNLIAYREVESVDDITTLAYLPACASIAAAAGTTPVRDFLLAATEAVGSVEAAVEIAGAPPEQHALFSFRQDVDCGGPAVVEVTSRGVANGGSFAVDLPAGDYRLVVSSFEKVTQAEDVTVPDGETVLLDPFEF